MLKLIGPDELMDYLNRRDVYIIDLRDREDYEDMHLKGAVSMSYDNCINLNRGGLMRRIILIYCHRGNLSLKACVRLDKKGYNVISVAGGFEGIKAYYNN